MAMYEITEVLLCKRRVVVEAESEEEALEIFDYTTTVDDIRIKEVLDRDIDVIG